MAIRKYKPTTPGLRGSSVADFAEVTRDHPEKSLVRPLHGRGGRNVPRVHLIEAGQLNTYDVLVADEVIFTEAALAEFVAGPAKGKRAGTDLPDLATSEIPGGIPSIAPAVGEGTVEETTEEKA